MKIPEPKQAANLKRQLSEIIPDNYTIRFGWRGVRHGNNISECYHCLIADLTTPGCNVTYHNSDSFVQLIMHVADPRGEAIPNPAWEKLCGQGIPFRKLSATKNATASERLITWAKRTFPQGTKQTQQQEKVKWNTSSDPASQEEIFSL